METLIHVPSGRQTLRPRDWFPINAWFIENRVLEFSWMVGGWSEIVSHQSWEVLPEVCMEDNPGWVGLTKWDELSFVCMTGLVWPAWAIFKAHLHLCLILTEPPWTPLFLHSLIFGWTLTLFGICLKALSIPVNTQLFFCWQHTRISISFLWNYWDQNETKIVILFVGTTWANQHYQSTCHLLMRDCSLRRTNKQTKNSYKRIR